MKMNLYLEKKVKRNKVWVDWKEKAEQDLNLSKSLLEKD